MLSSRFDGKKTPVILIDGIILGNYTAFVVMGVTSDGEKLIMGVRIDSTENAQVCRDMLTCMS